VVRRHGRSRFERVYQERSARRMEEAEEFCNVSW
jgi:hypothetical protein